MFFFHSTSSSPLLFFSTRGSAVARNQVYVKRDTWAMSTFGMEEGQKMLPSLKAQQKKTKEISVVSLKTSPSKKKNCLIGCVCVRFLSDLFSDVLYCWTNLKHRSLDPPIGLRLVAPALHHDLSVFEEDAWCQEDVTRLWNYMTSFKT